MTTVTKLFELLRAARTILKEPTSEKAIDVLLEATLLASGAERGFVIVSDDDELVVHKARAFDEGEVPPNEVDFSTHLVQAALSSGKFFTTGNAFATHGQFDSVHKQARRTIAVAPFKYAGDMVGALVADNQQENKFTPQQLELLEFVGSFAGLILDIIHDTELTRARNADLELLHRATPLKFPRLVGSSAVFQDFVRHLERAAESSYPVLILGETGSGKECAARSIHEASSRRNARFVPVNCATLQDSLADSDLFGYVKGAFTGANADKAGLVEAAEGGTLFLDELAEATPLVQAKLLRFLEDGSYRRVSDNEERKANVRIVAATNKDLEACCAAGTFRKDLYYRLRIVVLKLPPLRERPEDVRPLATHILNNIPEIAGKRTKRLSSEALAALEGHTWSGNVRDLRGTLEGAYVVSDGVIDVEHLGAEFVDNELNKIKKALREANGNRSEAAKLMGWCRSKFYRRLDKHGIETKDQAK